MMPDAIVYVVDDDETVRRSLARLVRSVGLKVDTFASAQAFLEHKGQNRPSCLVLDVRLPGLSGLDLQTAMGQIQRTMPIIFITGRGNVPMTEHWRGAGRRVPRTPSGPTSRDASQR